MPSPRSKKKTPQLWILAAGMLISCKSKNPAPANPTSKTPQKTTTPGEKYVDARLIPLDASGDGQWDTLAIEWIIAPGWHIYWTNPGDSGIATKVQFGGPSQEALSPARLPAPTRWESPGEILGYGYTDHTAFFATRSGNIAAGTPIQAKLSWLVCRDACHKGKRTLSLPAPSKPSPWTAALTKAYARLVSPAPKSLLQSSWQAGQNQLFSLELRATQGQILEFYPYETQPPAQDLGVEQGKLHLQYRAAPGGQTPDTAQGVVGVQDQEKLHFYEIATPWPWN